MSRTCIVIPCYNEEKRIPVSEFRDFFSQLGEVDALFVNDGSSDATSMVLDRLGEQFSTRIRILHLGRNVGKAEAVRRGILEVVKTEGFDYVGYFDADLATPLSEVSHFLEVGKKRDASMMFGARVKRLGIRLDRSALRHYVGRFFATAASILLGLSVYDTQCGAKLFKTALAKEIFKDPFLSRWFFDVEIFFRLIAFYGRDRIEQEVIEVPLESWIEKGATKVKAADFIIAPFELLRIFCFYRQRISIQKAQPKSIH